MIRISPLPITHAAVGHRVAHKQWEVSIIFSVTAMTRQQTVIVVVPFAALVDNIVSRGEAAGLDCEEWVNEGSGNE